MGRLLVLSASPNDHPVLRLDREVRQIREALSLMRVRSLSVEQHGAVQVEDLRRQLEVHRPRIVHFCGHADETGELLLVDPQGGSHPVAIQDVCNLFAQLQKKPKCVVLNACNTDILARELSRYVDCVVGMPGRVDDNSAIAFTEGFYRAIGSGLSVGQAVLRGGTDVRLFRLPDIRAELCPRQGVDPDKVILAGPLQMCAEFRLVRKKPAYDEEAEGYEISLHVNNVGDAVSVVYQLNDEDFDYVMEEVEEPGGGGFDYKFTAAGDFELRATVWYEGEGVGLVDTLAEALDRHYGPDPPKAIREVIEELREYEPEEEEEDDEEDA